jgi:hypothetical protein
VSDLTQALTLFNEARHLCEITGNAWALAAAHGGLALVGTRHGDWHTVSISLAESLRLWTTLKDRWGVAHAVEGAGWVAAAWGKSDVASRLFGASAAILASVGATLWPFLNELHQTHIDRLRASVGDRQFDEWWIEGHAWSWRIAAGEATTLFDAYRSLGFTN